MRFELELYCTKTTGTYSRWFSGHTRKYEEVNAATDEADRTDPLLYRQSKQVHKSQWDCVQNSTTNKHAGPVREIACRPLEKEQIEELHSDGYHFHHELEHARTYHLATACGDGQIRFRYIEIPKNDGFEEDGPAAENDDVPEPTKQEVKVVYPRLEPYINKEGLTLPPFCDHKTTIHSICISHDGRFMVSSGDDVFVAKYDTVLGKVIGVFNYSIVPDSSKSNKVWRCIVFLFFGTSMTIS